MSRVERQALVEAAFGPAEYVEQESFVRASEIRSLAHHAGVGPGVSVLDLCCGIAGPGRLLTRELGCDYLGVDSSASAVAIARERARDLPCRFEVAEIPPLPPGEFDVVLLLETMLAFQDKEVLLGGISDALPAGGRFAFTLEEGRPLSQSERAQMPDADTVWLTPLNEMHALLEGGRPDRPRAGGLERAAPCDSRGPGRRLRAGRRRAHGCAPAVGRVARDGARPQVRDRGGAPDPMTAADRTEYS